MSKPLDEPTLRDAQDFLVDRIVGQGRELGAEPNVRAARDFIAPILRRVEVDHEDQVRAGTAPEPLNLDPRDGVKVETETVGRVRWNLETDEAVLESLGGTPLALEPEESEERRICRTYWRMLKAHAAWPEIRQRFLVVLSNRDTTPEQKRRRLNDVWRALFHHFGDPFALAAASSKITVGPR